MIDIARVNFGKKRKEEDPIMTELDFLIHSTKYATWCTVLRTTYNAIPLNFLRRISKNIAPIFLLFYYGTGTYYVRWVAEYYQQNNTW
jgi:hypothetical protein